MVALPYSPDSKKLLLKAFESQRQWNHRHVYPEDLLLGLIWTQPALIDDCEALKKKALDLSLTSSWGRVFGHVQGKYDWSDEAREALVRASAFAAAESAAMIDPPHILWGLSSADSRLGELLRHFGATPPDDPTPLTNRDEGFSLELDDDSDQPYYRQIVEEIKRGVAEGRLIPGEQLQTVRSLADALSIAPGTVGRAYRLLQEEGVIVTDRANGTTVAIPMEEGSDPDGRTAALVELLRPVAISAYHLGASFDELLAAARIASEGVFE